MSSFGGVDLFGSGPHRFLIERQGTAAISYLALDTIQPGTFAYGELELNIRVVGRLVAASEAGLWGLRDAIAARAASTWAAGVLEDGRGRAWSGMKLLTYEEQGSVLRGRSWSVGYEARFRRFLA